MWSILCPKCGGVLALPSEADAEQVCTLCGERVPPTPATWPTEEPSPTSIDPQLTMDDVLIFHALRVCGGKACTLPLLFYAADACYRHVPSARGWEDGLNRLLAAGLIEPFDDGFSIRDEVARAVDNLGPSERMANDKVVRFVISRGPLESVARRITIRASDYEAAYAEYQRMFDEVAREAPAWAQTDEGKAEISRIEEAANQCSGSEEDTDGQAAGGTRSSEGAPPNLAP